MFKRARLLMVAGVVTSAAITCVAAGPASAHGGPAKFEVMEATAHEGRVVTIQLAVTHSSDGDPADGAFLSAVGNGPGSRTTAPLDLTRQAGGIYQLRTVVDSVGTWDFTITSRFPAGSTTVAVVVNDERSPDEDEDDGDGTAIWIALVAAIVLAALAIMIVRRRRARGR